jgi:hypothetical protein
MERVKPVCVSFIQGWHDPIMKSGEDDFSKEGKTRDIKNKKT